MLFTSLASTWLLALASVSAEQIPENHILWGEGGKPSTLIQKRQASATSSAAATATSRVADSACSNGPFSRTCWSNGYSAATDFDAKWPTTGKTVSYTLELTNGTCNPDGNGARPCQLFNGKFPGPTISANWGDMIQVTLKNSLTSNGTGIHWHGIRQLNSVSQDGVPGITECPLAPGKTKTYSFQATQHGTTWYHSHFSGQYGDGAFGAVVINGPASSNYDIDLGPFTMMDWYYPTSWQFGITAHNKLQAFGPPPNADTVLINGTNVNAAGNTGSRNKYSGLVSGKKYRLRLINTSSDNTIRVSLDNHPFTAITSDLVPIKPFSTNTLLIAVGQRYDVIFTANQPSGNYWFRATAVDACASGNSNPKAQAIFSYAGASSGDPTSTAYADPGDCNEPTTLTPWVKNTVDQAAFLKQVGNLNMDLYVTGVNTNGQNIVIWGVNASAIDVQWEKPTLQYIKDGNTSYPSALNLIELPTPNIWSYWIIQEPANSPAPIPHPIHLHGHDFYVVGRGSGVFDKSTAPASMTWENPTRRDVALLPGGGWLAIAFPTDNAGAWLMHCHIAFHVGEGLAVQFLETKGQAPLGNSEWDQTCKDWNEYQKTMPYPKVDSGL